MACFHCSAVKFSVRVAWCAVIRRDTKARRCRFYGAGCPHYGPGVWAGGPNYGPDARARVKTAPTCRLSHSPELSWCRYLGKSPSIALVCYRVGVPYVRIHVFACACHFATNSDISNYLYLAIRTTRLGASRAVFFGSTRNRHIFKVLNHKKDCSRSFAI